MAHLLERFYPHVPAWAQNLGISLYGLSYRRERLGGDFETHVAGFQERDDWSSEKMQAYVHEQLRSALTHAFEQVPYYQKTWSKVGATRADLANMTVAGLQALPITPKRDLRTTPDAFVGARNLFAALERAGERFTFGMGPAEVPRYLGDRGLALELDIGAADYRARYFGGAADRMRGHEFYRVALARVAPRAA